MAPYALRAPRSRVGLVDAQLLDLLLVRAAPVETLRAASFEIAANVGPHRVMLAHTRLHVQPHAGTVEGVKRLAVLW